MKKTVIALIVITFLICPLFAETTMGVKMISSGGNATSTVSLDDLKLNVEVPIDGYGIIKATSFEFFDWLAYYSEGTTAPNQNNTAGNKNVWRTGSEADFAMLRIDITNRMTKAKDFLENVKVKVIFEDHYEFEGWCYQFNYDNSSYNNAHYYSSTIDNGKQNTKWVVSKKDQFPIKPMYAGHYVFGCTLPNAVINSKSPLRMEITIDGNVITYNIRK